ncbi:RNA polymerase sigma factor [Proteiniphilum sp. UBA5384]|uniref:RNA polymerase sigma factor n=1 Tax=Proteiniphilum sp. UBA5384 TaxID=1947279 RepID=UPI0025D4A29F|nr:RNA polymerase sigma-70 factor [Proteiniphilum sp. UBA5384]
MQQPEPNIQQLFYRIKEGDKAAFNILFRLQYETILGFAKSYLGDTRKAGEVVSDLFVWLWLNRERIDGIDSPEIYLFKSVKNRCLNALRNNNKVVPIDEQPLPVQPSTDDTPLSLIEHKELSARLHTLIKNLPAQQRQVFKMIKESGLTARQTAKILDLSQRTVETHLYKAVKKLEEEISLYLGYSPCRKQMKKILAVLW